MVLALTRLWKREILQKAGGTCLRNRFPEMFSLQGSILKRLVFYSPSQYSRYSQKFGLVLTLWKYSLRKLTGLSGLLATLLAITWLLDFEFTTLPYPSRSWKTTTSWGLVLTLSSLWKYSLRKLTGLSGLETHSWTMHSFNIFWMSATRKSWAFTLFDQEMLRGLI